MMAEELIAPCRDNVARHKVPRHVVFTELPKTSIGKVQKLKFWEKAEEEDCNRNQPKIDLIDDRYS